MGEDSVACKVQTGSQVSALHSRSCTRLGNSRHCHPSKMCIQYCPSLRGQGVGCTFTLPSAMVAVLSLAVRV